MLAGGVTQPVNVFLLGAAPGVADRAASRIESKYNQVRMVGTCSPPLGFQHDEQQNGAILEQIRDARPDLLIIGLGAPKQELWVHRHRQAINASVAVCAGATIDFLAGENAYKERLSTHRDALVDLVLWRNRALLKVEDALRRMRRRSRGLTDWRTPSGVDLDPALRTDPAEHRPAHRPVIA